MQKVVFVDDGTRRLFAWKKWRRASSGIGPRRQRRSAIGSRWHRPELFPDGRFPRQHDVSFASSMQLPHQQVAPQRLQQEAATSKERVQAQAKDPSSSSMNIFKEDAPQKRKLHSLHNQHTLRTANSHIHTHVNTHRSRPSPTTHMHSHARRANTLPHDARAHTT